MMIRWARIILIAVLLIPASLQAKPLHEVVSYEQFEELYRHCLSEIPELKPVWNWRSGGHTPNIQIEGNLVPGLA